MVFGFPHARSLATEALTAGYVPQRTILLEDPVERMAKHDGSRWRSMAVDDYQVRALHCDSRRLLAFRYVLATHFESGRR